MAASETRLSNEKLVICHTRWQWHMTIFFIR